MATWDKLYQVQIKPIGLDLAEGRLDVLVPWEVLGQPADAFSAIVRSGLWFSVEYHVDWSWGRKKTCFGVD